MAIASYADLKDRFTGSTINWLARPFSSDEADEFIQLAEGFFNVNLRCRQMEAIDDLTPSSGVCALPSDYLEYVRVVEKTTPRRRLDFISADAADALYPTREAGSACHFAIIGSSLYTFPLTSNDIELTYYQKLPALSGSQTSNWLLALLPNLYLHTTLLMAAEYIRDAGKMGAETEFVGRYMDMLTTLDNRSKYANVGVTMTETFVP